MTSFHDEATPIWGLSQSSSVMPTARSIARAGAFCMPSVTSCERGLNIGHGRHATASPAPPQLGGLRGHTAAMVAVLALLVGAIWAALDLAGRPRPRPGQRRDLVVELIGVPIAAALCSRSWSAAARRPGPWLLALLLVAPMALAFVLHDRAEDRRPAYWPVGWTLLAVLAAICAAVGLARRSPR